MKTIDIIRELTAPICSNPQGLKIVSKPLPGVPGQAITVTPHGSDMRRFVGKGGVNIKALQCLASAIGAANREPVVLTLAEPLDGTPPVDGAPPLDDWDTAPIERAVRSFLAALRKPPLLTVQRQGAGRVTFILGCSLSLPGKPTSGKGITEALTRWVSVMGHSLGGTAFVNTPASTVAANG